MPQFFYTVKDTNGKTTSDTTEAFSEDALVDRLQKDGYYILKVQSLAEVRQKTKPVEANVKYSHNGIKLDDKIVFARQLEGLAQKGDVPFGLSTSGNSKNVIEAVKKAKVMGLTTISLTGCGGGQLAALTDVSIVVPSNVTARIQESHLCVYHTICELVENKFAKS